MKEGYIARKMVSSKLQLHSTFLPTVYYFCFLFNSSCFEMLAPRLVILIDFIFSSVTPGILWGCYLRVHHDYILYNISCTHISAFHVSLQWESRHYVMKKISACTRQGGKSVQGRGANVTTARLGGSVTGPVCDDTSMEM